MEDLEGEVETAARVESHMNILVTGMDGYIGFDPGSPTASDDQGAIDLSRPVW